MWIRTFFGDLVNWDNIDVVELEEVTSGFDIKQAKYQIVFKIDLEKIIYGVYSEEKEARREFDKLLKTIAENSQENNILKFSNMFVNLSQVVNIRIVMKEFGFFVVAGTFGLSEIILSRHDNYEEAKKHLEAIAEKLTGSKTEKKTIKKKRGE